MSLNKLFFLLAAKNICGLYCGVVFFAICVVLLASRISSHTHIRIHIHTYICAWIEDEIMNLFVYLLIGIWSEMLSPHTDTNCLCFWWIDFLNEFPRAMIHMKIIFILLLFLFRGKFFGKIFSSSSVECVTAAIVALVEILQRWMGHFIW